MERHVIITGANGLIGQGLCRGFLSDGWRVTALDLATEAMPEGVAAVECDVADEASVAAATNGLDRLDLLVNCAGLADPHRGPVEALSLDLWRRITDSHLTGAFLMTRACVQALRAARGAIVNLSSTRAIMSEPNSEAYAASKGGIEALTHALAVSLGPEIRVNAVAPGWITGTPDDLREVDHDQHPAGRVGVPDDIFDAVRYLAGAGFVTGQILRVDGGMTRKMIYED